jgi:hypothetical protein
VRVAALHGAREASRARSVHSRASQRNARRVTTTRIQPSFSHDAGYAIDTIVFRNDRNATSPMRMV